MNLGRRIIVVIALAMALAVVAATLSRLLIDDQSATGWFTFDPDGGSPAMPVGTGSSDDDAVLVGAVWLAAVGVWFVAAWWLFRSRRD